MTDLGKLERVKILCNPTIDAKVRAAIVNNSSNLSRIVFSRQGKYLWLGTDEFTAIERFTWIENSPSVFGEHHRFYFKDLINGFDQEQGDVDVEGFDYSD
jgi:hypothetical protein